MKQYVVRQELTGDWEEFTFDVKGRSFFVKNFTDGDIYVSFSDDEDENGAFKIPSLTAEEIFVKKASAFYTDALFIKGTGEVEVEVLDY